MGAIYEVAGIIGLNDGSMEMAVLNPYLPNLKRKVDGMFLDSILDFRYEPFQTQPGQSELLGIQKVRALARAQKMTDSSWLPRSDLFF